MPIYPTGTTGGGGGGGGGITSVIADAPLSGQGTGGSHLVIANASGAAVGVVQLAGDLGGTPTAPTVTNLANVVNGSLADAGIGGMAYSKLTAGPNVPEPAWNGYTGWTMNPDVAIASFTPTAGVIYLAKLYCRFATTINAIDFGIAAAGTGATSLANCFVGLYDSGGTQRVVSADQSTAWASAGSKSLSLGGSPYAVAAGAYVYFALLIGTQSTTQCGLSAAPSATGPSSNLGLPAGTDPMRAASILTAQTSLPASLTLSGKAAARLLLFAVK